MKIQNISNSQQNTNFQGNLILKGEFGTIATKHIREAVPQLRKIIDKEPFDLFIQQHQRGENVLEVFAQNFVDHLNNKNNKKVSAFVSETGDMISAADNVVSGYKNDIQSKKLWERIKAAYFKFEDYYFEMLDDIGK